MRPPARSSALAFPPAGFPARAFAAVAIFLAACKSAPPPAPIKIAPTRSEPEPAGGAISKQRQTLRVTPLDLAFSGVRGEPGSDQSVSVKNVSPDAQQIKAVRVVGDDAASFSLTGLPTLPRYIAVGKSIDFSVAFAPAADARPGVMRATLQVLVGDGDELGPLVDVSALVLQGREGENEPPLAQVVETLGYRIDVGGTTLSIGADDALKGEEIGAGLFQSTKPGNIALDPVARFSPDGPLPYGFYRAAAPNPADAVATKDAAAAANATTLTPLGTLAAGQHQQINPGFQDGEGQISFDPGSAPFGIYVTSATRTTYTQNVRNAATATAGKQKPDKKAASGAASARKKRGKPPAETIAHAVRVYPLKSRNGTPIANAYLVAFEEASNGDYQDYVFVLWNVRPVDGAPPPTPAKP